MRGHFLLRSTKQCLPMSLRLRQWVPKSGVQGLLVIDKWGPTLAYMANVLGVTRDIVGRGEYESRTAEQAADVLGGRVDGGKDVVNVVAFSLLQVVNLWEGARSEPTSTHQQHRHHTSALGDY